MLITNKSRSINAQFYVENEGIKELVKTTTINIDQNAVASISEQVVNNELYAANRAEMREDEAKLSELRYKIEDEILAEAEAEKDTEESAEESAEITQ